MSLAAIFEEIIVSVTLEWPWFITGLIMERVLRLRSGGMMIVRKVPYQAVGLLGIIEGLYDYFKGGQISDRAWQRLLRAHVGSNGRFTEWMRSLVAMIRPKKALRTVTGLLGTFSPSDLEKIVDILQRDGFYMFDVLMPPDVCDELQRYAERTPAWPSGDPRKASRAVVYDAENPVGPVYKFREPDTIHCPAMQKLISDDVFIAISEAYIGAEPAIGGIDMWWSARYGNAPSSDAAQLFHFDFDAPPIWLKLFVYLTDVGPDDGPHVFVKGTHQPGLTSAAALRARGYQRIDDSDVEVAFGKEAVLSVTGLRGTVFFADTRAFHKGTVPTAHHRLVAQLIYCAPFFNDHILPAEIPNVIIPELRAALRERPRVYERFTRGRYT